MRGERIEITCETCGKVFSWLKSQGVRKHCSRACKSAGAARVEGDCLNCGKHVVKLKSQTTYLKYCSRECQLAHTRRALQACEHCGEDFKPQKGRSDQRFCSVACRGAAVRKAGTSSARIDGRSAHPLYPCWYNMIRRCTNPQDPGYPQYGGRGISICDEWRQTPASFYRYVEENLGPKPKGKSLDRIDNNGHYEPGNIRWASPLEQIRNRRPFVVDYSGDGPRPLALIQEGPKVWAIRELPRRGRKVRE